VSDAAVSAVRSKRVRLKAQIDADACSGCMVCMDSCPAGCISKEGEEIYPHHVYGYCVVETERCTGCRACERHCPWEAIEMVAATGSAR